MAEIAPHDVVTAALQAMRAAGQSVAITIAPGRVICGQITRGPMHGSWVEVKTSTGRVFVSMAHIAAVEMA